MEISCDGFPVDNVDPSKVRREIILSVLTETGELTTNSIMGLPNTSSKTKGTGDLSKTKIKEMMREARLMRNFKHKNIVRIYGVAVDEQPLYIILELVKGGALNIYLRTNANSVDIREKIAMCLGSALGIEYLHKQNCIHMDLAARNCLYSEDKVVKISDFGLSRIGSQYTIRTAMKLPIKWLAPETITTFTFSLKTDVFSYGVMVYEIFADGGEPWDGVTNAEVKKGLTEGRVLTLPMSCPEKLRNFIRDRVYTKEPGGRATMSEVIRFFVENMQSESLEMEMKTDEKDKALKEDGERSLFDRLVRSPLKSVISDPSAHIESFEDKVKIFLSNC
uniref:Protein kinase domain-containing protein n=1 Tax=Heterorhabditis bacteriophora TaxID=37862 RepID=A0A1I7WMS0_HETBA